ncbi:MAG: hypothetical protein F6K19_18945 [Cyanothece sp. SIO1E1]|nr:hypothetical protein [Cyanothece sp. SIO1E1]
MQKKYVVRLTEEERYQLREVIKKLKGSGQQVRRAQILLKADAEGTNWTDQRIAEAFGCRTKTVENIRHVWWSEDLKKPSTVPVVRPHPSRNS